MQYYSRPDRPIEYAERMLVMHILNGTFTIGDRLPPERELAGKIGVTRPTLREALRRLEQEGWLLVQHGKPTVVRDFWREGGVGVLGRIIRYQGFIKPSFISNLLEFRLLLAPSFTRDAVAHDSARICAYLDGRPAEDASPTVYAAFDWELARELTVTSANVIFPVILNDFAGFYEKTAVIYFQRAEARRTSLQYYAALAAAAATGDSQRAYHLTVDVMQASLRHWQAVSEGLHRIPLGEDVAI
jgi:GntR family transcriptional regulator, negative regulator for fad regulon and positive regulator of fabA